jgi:hypothetical protein
VQFPQTSCHFLSVPSILLIHSFLFKTGHKQNHAFTTNSAGSLPKNTNASHQIAPFKIHFSHERNTKQAKNK